MLRSELGDQQLKLVHFMYTHAIKAD